MCRPSDYPPYTHEEDPTVTTATDTTYNGWTNWETWNTALWIGNEEPWYDEARRVVADAYEPDDREDLYDAGQALRAWYEDATDPDTFGGPALIGPIADAWNATLSAVDWSEIAGHYLPDIDEED